MIRKGEKRSGELICDNCIKLEERKRALSQSIKDTQVEIKHSIENMESHIKTEQSQSLKQQYLEKIKEKSEILKKSIQLLKKIEETNDEKYIEEYKKLFEEIKKKSMS